MEETKMATSKSSTKRSRKPKIVMKSRAGVKPPPYLKKLSTAVREHFAGAIDLATFLTSAGELSPEQRKLIVQQALILIEQNYAHLPLKRAMHSIDPTQRLKLLLQSLEQMPAA